MHNSYDEKTVWYLENERNVEKILDETDIYASSNSERLSHEFIFDKMRKKVEVRTSTGYLK